MTTASPVITALRADDIAFWIDLQGAPGAVRVDRRVGTIRFNDPQGLIQDLKRVSIEIGEPVYFKPYEKGQEMEVWIVYRAADTLHGPEVEQLSCIGHTADRRSVQRWTHSVNMLLDVLGVAWMKR